MTRQSRQSMRMRHCRALPRMMEETPTSPKHWRSIFMSYLSKLRLVPLLLLLSSTTWAQASTQLNERLQAFKSLTGPQQVTVVLNERLHGRSLLFWRRSAETWRSAADARLAFEEDILVSSSDTTINAALAAEIKSTDVER